MDNEEKYLDIRDKLKGLEPVKASDSFVHNLHSKIVEIESEKRKEHEKKYNEGRGGFLKNLFGNLQYPWLVPAAGFTILIFFVFYMTFLSKNSTENKQDLLSNKTQEPVQQQNTPSVESGTTDKTPPTNNESEKNITGNKTEGKDLASDLKTEGTERNEKSPVPVETRTEGFESSEKKVYREKSKPEPSDNEAETYDGMVAEKKSDDKTVDTDEKNKKQELTAPKLSDDQQGSTDSQKFSKGALSEEPKKARLKQKIDSLSKVDLEKLREEILK